MSSEAEPTRKGDLTNFDIAEGAGAGAPACTSCAKPITDVYHEANGAVICSVCRAKLEAELKSGSAAGRFARAVGFGLVGAILGSGLYFAVLKITGYEIGLIAIAVGFMVGRGVQLGARGRGGWRYQTLAIALTYSAIVVTYIPFLIDELQSGLPNPAAAVADSLAVAPVDSAALTADAVSIDSTAAETTAEASAAGVGLGGFIVAVLVLFAFAAAAPVLAGVENIIGLLIIGFALYQAWSMNRRAVIDFTGPYRLAARAPGEGTAAA